MFDARRTGYSVPRCPLRSIRTPSGCRDAPKDVLAASREVVVPLRVCSTRAVPAIRFPGPSTALPTSGSPSRCSGPRLSPSSEDDGSSSHRLRLFFRDPFRHRLFTAPQRTVDWLGSSSHEVLCPSSERKQVIGQNAEVPAPTPAPHGLSQTLGGFPHRLLRACFVPLPLMGFRPFRAFPSRRTLPGSSPGDTLSTFLFPLRRARSCAPRALRPARVRYRSGSIASLVGPLLSWASPLPRHSTTRVGGAITDDPSARDLGIAGLLARP
jgi:hypothetical protein